MFFNFPEHARRDAALQAVVFGVGIGEYEGVVRVCRARCPPLHRRLGHAEALP